MQDPKTEEFLGTLLDAGIIPRDVAQRAAKDENATVEETLDALVGVGAIEQEQVVQLLELHYKVPYVDLERTFPDLAAVRLVPEKIARQHSLIAIAVRDGELVVAMTDPQDLVGSDVASHAAGMPVRPVLARREHVQQAIERLYSPDGNLEATAAEIERSMPDLDAEAQVDPAKLERLQANAPVADFVESFILRAIELRASDIHVEPGPPDGVVRVRVDGVLRDIAKVPMKAYPAVASRIKVLCEMDIGQRRVPQDGRFSMTVDGRRIDFRVSSLPTMGGEKVVMRILDKDRGHVPIAALGLTEDEFAKVTRAIARPYGIFIVTGPTGSGKTTTLYSMLQGLDRLQANIVTCEDPVEYELERINQVQLNTSAGLTFGSFMRSVLRQDPDVIMVGEMRDTETAALAVRAALTGHLVMTTLHTNDAVGVATRLVDMGVEPFLIASTLVCAIAQRLVRTICPHCKESYIASNEELGVAFPDMVSDGEFTAWRGHGCRACNHTGYSGRRGIFEVLTPDREVRRLITSNADATALSAAAQAGGMTTLRDAAVREVRAGVVTLEEAARVTAETED